MILITGGSGFIGQNLIRLLAKTGEKVIYIDLQESQYILPGNIEFRRIDIRSKEQLFSLPGGYSVVYHCAGLANVNNSVQDPALTFDINTLGTVNLLEFSRQKECGKFILLSTVSVFDADNEFPLNEYSKKKVSSPYGASKLASEAFCNAYFKTYKLDTRIARIFNTYGPGQKGLFIFDMVKKIMEAREKIEFTGTGRQVRDYMYIDDISTALHFIASKGAPGEDYNICTGVPLLLTDLIRIILRLMKREDIAIHIKGVPLPGDIEKWYGNPSKLASLGFTPATDIETGLKISLPYFIAKCRKQL